MSNLDVVLVHCSVMEAVASLAHNRAAGPAVVDNQLLADRDMEHHSHPLNRRLIQAVEMSLENWMNLKKYANGMSK